MVIINGKKFVENDAEFIDSLFAPGGTCVGYVRANKRSITLMDMQQQKVGAITRYGVLACATKLDGGQWWYTHATIGIIGEHASYMREQDDISDALRYFGIARRYSA